MEHFTVKDLEWVIMCPMELSSEYEFNDVLTDSIKKYEPSLVACNTKKIDGGNFIDGVNWRGVSIEDARSLPLADDPYLVMKFRLVQNPGSSKIQRILKEYTNGDFVHGFLELKNTSSEPIHFDAFYLSLEGHMVVTNPLSRSRTTKTILKMDNDERLEKDQVGYVGLPSDKILRPHTNYRKEFVFRIPDSLLETVCQCEIPEHSDLPPSVGLDKHHKQFKYQNLRIDTILGYARANEFGSPIWSCDLAEDLSIDYSIEAIFVGRNVGNGGHCILKQSEYYVRIIPSNTWSPSTEDSQIVERRLSYKVVNRPTVLKRFLHLLFASKETLDKSGVIILTASVPQRALPYHSPPLITHQNAFEFKNDLEQQNRLKIKDIIPRYQCDPLKNICVKIRYIPKDHKVLPKLCSVNLELLSITGKSSHHIPSKISYEVLLDEDKLHQLRKKSPEFSTLHIDTTTLSDVFRVQKTSKWFTKDRWYFNGSEYEQDVVLDLEYSKNLCKTLIPSFTSCMCFRRYCLRVNMLFDDRLNCSHLIIPVDVWNTFL